MTTSTPKADCLFPRHRTGLLRQPGFFAFLLYLPKDRMSFLQFVSKIYNNAL